MGLVGCLGGLLVCGTCLMDMFVTCGCLDDWLIALVPSNFRLLVCLSLSLVVCGDFPAV